MQSKETLEIEVIDYLPFKLSPTSTNRRPQEQLAIFTDSVVSSISTLLSSVLDVLYSLNSCSTGNNTSERGSYHNIDDFDEEILQTELEASFEKLTNIMTIDLIENKPLILDDLIF